MALSGTRTGRPETPATRLVARAIGAIFSVGGTLAVIWTMLPHPNTHGDRVVLAMASLALAVGVVMSTGIADSMRLAGFHLTIGLIQVVITVGYVAAAVPTNDLRLFYLWTLPLAGFAFRPKHAAMHLAWVGALLAVSLGLQHSPLETAVRIWMMTFGTVAAVGALVVFLAAAVRRRESELDRAVQFDALTGLANRVRFGRLATEALHRREAEGGRTVLFLADLDRFKVVNDTQGHGTGDELLLHIAASLREVVPQDAIVARLGGDEFAVLVEDEDGYLDVDGLAHAIATIWRDPVSVSAGTVHAGACLGVASSTQGDTPSSLLRDAEAAMLRAKKQGPGTISVFRVEQRQADDRRYRIERGLHDAAQLGQFHLVFQPVVELSTGRLRACEVLLRWTHPDLGEVSPAEFIPVAEDHGLVGPIGTWVLEQSIAQLGAWIAADIVPADFRISVNVSGHQLHAALPKQIGRLLTKHRVDPGSIMIELTETVIISAGTETNETLTELRAMGLALVLDDFGTGFSSLSHLQRARFDAVKIDRSFVRGVVDAGTDRSIIGAILALAEALDINVVAEGVETRAQSDALQSLGCVFAQGYLFDRPLTAETFATRLTMPTLRAIGPGSNVALTGTPVPPRAVGQSF